MAESYGFAKVRSTHSNQVSLIHQARIASTEVCCTRFLCLNSACSCCGCICSVQLELPAREATAHHRGFSRIWRRSSARLHWLSAKQREDHSLRCPSQGAANQTILSQRGNLLAWLVAVERAGCINLCSSIDVVLCSKHIRPHAGQQVLESERSHDGHRWCNDRVDTCLRQVYLAILRACCPCGLGARDAEVSHHPTGSRRRTHGHGIDCSTVLYCVVDSKHSHVKGKVPTESFDLSYKKLRTQLGS